MSCVLSRLIRACAAAGNTSLQFICCSATLSDPVEHFLKLVPCLTESNQSVAAAATGSSPWLDKTAITAVVKDGSARGERHFALWKPKNSRKPGSGGNRPLMLPPPLPEAHRDITLPTTGAVDVVPLQDGSPIFETAMLLAALVKAKVRTLVFCKIRKLTELVLAYALRELEGTGLASKIKAYRAGYTLSDRRRLERELFDGTLLGAVATSALELGVDIGGLDCTVLLGFPGSISSMWQQAGRSGRSGRDALTLMVLWDSPMEQYISRHPAYLFDRGVESIALDPENAIVLRSHVLCAAAESAIVMSQPKVESDDVDEAFGDGTMLLERSDDALFGPGLKAIVAELARDKLLNSVVVDSYGTKMRAILFAVAVYAVAVVVLGVFDV